MTLSVCIATFRRLDRLDLLLDDLEQQELPPDEVVIVDNDTAGSAQSVVERRIKAGSRLKLVYEIQPERNISLTRNRTVHRAQGDWLAFIDDDERAPRGWLRQLVEAAQRFNADAILAPVEPQVPATAPSWIRKGHFYDWPHLPTGAEVPASNLRFGNALLRGSLLRALPGPFDPDFRLSTGEDGEMLMRLRDQHRARIIWCDEAIVWEPVEAKRLSLRWLMQRALSGGQHFARLSVGGRFHSNGGRYDQASAVHRCAMLLRWLAQLLIAALLATVCLPLGRHRAAAWLIKASANVGKLSALIGWRYGEYA